MSGLNDAPSADRVQIGIFGRVNAGKSSLLNALTGQSIAVVSEIEGTTTDPVRKAMELLPIGPVVFSDTPGLSDESALGEKRKEKALGVLRRVDLGILAMDASVAKGFDEKQKSCPEKRLVRHFREKGLPYIVVVNKCETLGEDEQRVLAKGVADFLSINAEDVVCFSCAKPLPGMDAGRLRERLSDLWKRKGRQKKQLIGDVIKKNEVAILVIPIDESAPKGRLILPQQQVLRELLDIGAVALSVQPDGLAEAIHRLKEPPAIVITDSQAFEKVAQIVEKDIPITSFSIIMARYKGDLSWQAEGARAIETLDRGAKILVSEGCTHHRMCKDIGTVKLPGWIEEYSGKRGGGSFEYTFTSGGEFPEDISDFDLIIHCGGCVLPEREMEYRINKAKEAGIPITNYGTMIAHLHGLLDRATEVFEGGRTG